MSDPRANDDGFLWLEDISAHRYIPRRQPNPHLKKYYNRRPLPWSCRKLSSMSGWEDDLDDYRKYLWEQDKKKEKQSCSSNTSFHPSPSHITPRTINSFKVSNYRPIATESNSTTSPPRQQNSNKKKNSKRPQNLHILNALKATAKRQGWQRFYAANTCCYCCIAYSLPWSDPHQYFRRAGLIEFADSAEDILGSKAQFGVGAAGKNPQQGRRRFHEGVYRDLEGEKTGEERRMTTRRYQMGGRGMRPWMRAMVGLGERGGRLVDGESKDGDGGGGEEDAALLDQPVQTCVSSEQPGYWVRYGVLPRRRRGESGGFVVCSMPATDEGLYWDPLEMLDSEGDQAEEDWVWLADTDIKRDDVESVLSWVEIEEAVHGVI